MSCRDTNGANIIHHVCPFTSIVQGYLLIITQLWNLVFVFITMVHALRVHAEELDSKRPIWRSTSAIKNL